MYPFHIMIKSWPLYKVHKVHTIASSNKKCVWNVHSCLKWHNYTLQWPKSIEVVLIFSKLRFGTLHCFLKMAKIIRFIKKIVVKIDNYKELFRFEILYIPCKRWRTRRGHFLSLEILLALQCQNKSVHFEVQCFKCKEP